MKNVLVIAAHPDDEALGCGGTIAAHVARGDAVHTVFLTDGVGARGNEADSDASQRRRDACSAAGKALGIASTQHFDFPDNRLDTVALIDVTQALESVIARLSPQIIYTHHSNDLNVDHRICHQAVLTASRPQPLHPVRSIYGFEVASSTEWAFSAPTFQPRHFVEISAHLQTKYEALGCYAEEMRYAPHARSVEGLTALAHWRGHCVGCTAAEAFEIIRQIVKMS